MDLAESSDIITFDRSLLKGEAQKFYKNQPILWEHFKNSPPPRTDVGNQEHECQYSAEKIQYAVGIVYSHCMVSTALQASTSSSQNRGAFIAPFPMETNKILGIKVHCATGAVP
jgi:hypothetical protein